MNKELIESIFRAMVQSQIYHWLTDSPHIHNILGDFYESLQKLIDELAENSLSNYNKPTGNFTLQLDYNYNINKIDTCLLTCKDKLESELEIQNKETVKDSILAILKLVDKTIYLLHMKD